MSQGSADAPQPELDAVTLYTELLREKRAMREGEEHAPFDFRMPFGLPVPV